MLPELFLLIGCIVLTGWAGQQLWQSRRATTRLQEDFYRVVLWREEVRRYQVGRDQLVAAQIVTQKSVDVGLDTVRLAHNLIAAIPFTVLKNIPATREGAKAVRKTHDRVAGTVYDSITIVNKLTGHGLRSLLNSQKTDRAPPPKKPDPPPR